MEMNELLVHPVSGVCRMKGMTELKQGTYRMLSPLSDPNTTFYVPVNSEKVHLRPVISGEEALALIDSLPALEPLEFSTANERKQRFSEMLKSGDLRQLALLGKTVYSLQQARSRSGKNACASDRSAMREGEKLLYSELAVALDMTPAEVPGFISRRLQEAN